MTNATNSTVLNIRHIEVRTSLPVDQIHTRLLATLPLLDPNLVDMLRRGDAAAVERQNREGPPLWLFEFRDMGALLAVEGRAAKAYQYEIGNPLTAESMVRYQPAAGLYAPLRVVLYEDHGLGVLAYDLPSDLFGQFGDERVTAVGRELDRKLETVLRRAQDLSGNA